MSLCTFMGCALWLPTHNPEPLVIFGVLGLLSYAFRVGLYIKTGYSQNLFLNAFCMMGMMFILVSSYDAPYDLRSVGLVIAVFVVLLYGVVWIASKRFETGS